LNFVRIDEDLLVAGVAVRDGPNPSVAQRKRWREVGRDAITEAELRTVIERSKIALDAQIADLQARMDSVVDAWRQSGAYQHDVVELLREDLQRALAHVHDYKQFVQQIIQNMNVILETRYPRIELEAKLEQATHEEMALYAAATLMDERLDAALFLETPARIHEPREQRSFRLHGLVVKYLRIYKSRADNRGVTVDVHGTSWAG
jgi:hypothetical protein